MKITGFDKLKEQVPFDELFTSSFMKEHTPFSSIDELFSAGGFSIKSFEDFKAVSESVLNKHIAATTKFNTWQEFANEAGVKYAAKKLGF